MIYFIIALTCFLASIIGCICGIGGGVIIKPVMDAFQIYSVSTVSFMSSCIVLSMTTYSVIKAKLSKESVIEKGLSTFLGLGAAAGGIAGKQLFDLLRSSYANTDTVGAIQAAALFAVTLATVIYTLNKARIKTKRVEGMAIPVLIGFALGMMSAFLGIGGGPINLVALYYFFSMETKAAAQNSLYVILISQLASLIFTIVLGNVPDFPPLLLVLTVCCGILGGVVGRKINSRIDENTVSRLFVGLLCVIMLICCYNFAQFTVI